VADVDAGADRGHLAEALGDLEEPVELEPGGVLQEQHRALRPPVEPVAEPPEAVEQLAGPAGHVLLVVGDQAADPPGEPLGEPLHRRPARLLQQVHPAVEVDDRPVRGGRGEAEDPLELAGVVGVDLGGQPGLLEPEPGQPQQGVVAVDAALEQGVQRGSGRRGLGAGWVGRHRRLSRGGGRGW
jgi:hypothetical protein